MTVRRQSVEFLLLPLNVPASLPSTIHQEKTMSKGPKPRPMIERFVEKIEVDESGCWLWTGSLNNMGYPRLSGRDRKQPTYAHRFSYEFFIGPIPDGLVVDHTCSVPRCVCPDHLDAVTQQINLYRGHVRRGTARAFRPHGTIARYAAGCICADCRAANAKAQKDRRVTL